MVSKFKFLSIAALVVGAFSSLPAWSEEPTATFKVEFERRGGGWVQKVVELSDGYLVVSTTTIPEDGGRYAIWVLKLGTNGNKIWEQTPSVGVNNEPVFVRAVSNPRTRNQEFHIFLRTYSSSGSYRVWMLKLNELGREIGRRQISENLNNVYLNFVESAREGEGYIIGGSETLPEQQQRGWVLKIDRDGNPIGNKKVFESTSSDVETSYGAENSRGEIVIVNKVGVGSRDSNLVGINLVTINYKTGETINSLPVSPYVDSAKLMSTDRMILTGPVRPIPGYFDRRGGIRSIIAEFDPAGNGQPIWQRSIHGSSLDLRGVWSITEAPNQEVLITGYKYAPNYHDSRHFYYFARLTQRGHEIWARYLNPVDSRRSEHVESASCHASATRDGGVVTVGYSGVKLVVTKVNRDGLIN